MKRVRDTSLSVLLFLWHASDLGNLLPRNIGSSEISILYLGPIHTSCCCRAKPIIIRCFTSTAFFMFDSYVEPNLSNLITNQAKIAFVCEKMTGALNEEVLETSHNELEFSRTDGACLSSHNCLP